MSFLFKLSQRVARLRSRALLVAAPVIAGACAKGVVSPPAGGTPPVTIHLSATDAAPGGSVAVELWATERLAAIQETVAFDPQRLRYERPGDGLDLVVVNDEAAAQGSLRVLATSPQGLAPTGVTLVFTVIANGYAEGVRGTVELAVAPDGGLVWGAAPRAPDRVAGAGPTGAYRFGDANLDGLINLWDVLLLNRASSGATLAAQPFLLGNVRPVNGGAAATGMPPCDPATTCRPGVTPADPQNLNGRIEVADVIAVASRVIGMSVPVVGELAPPAPSTPATVASVTVSPATATVWVGQTGQLSATPKDSAGTSLTGRTVTWGSGDTSVARVSSSGQVTGRAPGSATITATSEGKAGSALVGRTVTWASGDTTVARVSPGGLVTGVASGSAPITAMSEDKSSTAAITMTTVPVASVAISPATGSLRVGQTLQFAATPKDSAGGALTGRSVTWTSSNPGVATVSASGLVTSGAVGTVTITATSEGKSGSAAITVSPVPVASVALAPSTASIRVGQTLQLTATPKDSAGGTLVGRTVTWAIGDTTVARVSSSGQMAGVAPGSATITATSEGKNGTAAITVTTVPVASIAVSPGTASVAVGQTVQLAATPKDSAGGALTGRSVTWTSSNPGVATVSASGLVTSGAVGTVTITATSEGKTGSAAVTVTLVPVASVVVSPATASIRVGQTVQLTATPKDSAGATLAGRTVTWASGDTTVARVSPGGLVTGVASGSAPITAMSEGKSSTAAITVTTVPVASVAISPATGSLRVGQTLQFAATPKDSAGGTLTGRTVTWASSNTGVATVSASGLVTSGAVGTVTITATSEGKSGSAAITVSPVPVASVAPAPSTGR